MTAGWKGREGVARCTSVGMAQASGWQMWQKTPVRWPCSWSGASGSTVGIDNIDVLERERGEEGAAR